MEPQKSNSAAFCVYLDILVFFFFFEITPQRHIKRRCYVYEIPNKNIDFRNNYCKRESTFNKRKSF